MNKPSRRNFGKQLTGAIVSLPLVASAIEIEAQQKVDQKKFREHDTPPPLLLMPGSLVLEAATDKNDWDSSEPGSTNRRKWLVTPKPYPDGTPPRDIYLAHVKLLDGSGEMLFHFDNESTIDHRAPIRITATLLQDQSPFGDCQVTTAGNHFEIEVPDSKKIKKKNNDPSTNQGLRQRVRYMSSNDDERCVFKSLRIDKGGVNIYNNTDLLKHGGFNDLRVMVWWANL